MDEGKLPLVHKFPEQGSSDEEVDGSACGTTADLGAAFVVDDGRGTWRPPSPTPAERELSDELQVVVAMRLSYRGEPFCGFAKQPGQLTVQGSVEEALALVFRHPVETVCAGRTDSGVHARGQWVSFSLSAKEWNERSEYKILKSLNALTHEDISVREIVRKDLDFSARFSARTREYRYFICTDQARPLLMRDFSWHLGKELDLDAMRKAASYLIGEHDFRSFCMAASAEGKTTNRNVVSIEIEPCQMWGENLVVITVIGNAFLHSMVRTIVGTLVMVGRGKRSPEWVAEVLEARNRSAAGENAPAAGLVFWKVNYEGEFVYDPEAKRKAQQAKELAQATARANRKFRLFGAPLFENLEFEIPRGNPRSEGELPLSGAWLSDVKSDELDVTGEIDQVDVGALRNPTNYQAAEFVPTPAATLTETGMFGDIEWDVELDDVHEGARNPESPQNEGPIEPETFIEQHDEGDCGPDDLLAEEPNGFEVPLDLNDTCEHGSESEAPQLVETDELDIVSKSNEVAVAQEPVALPVVAPSAEPVVLHVESHASSSVSEGPELKIEPRKRPDPLRAPSGKHAKKKRYPFEERPLPYQLK